MASLRSTRKMIRQMARTVTLQEPARSPLSVCSWKPGMSSRSRRLASSSRASMRAIFPNHRGRLAAVVLVKAPKAAMSIGSVIYARGGVQAHQFNRSRHVIHPRAGKGGDRAGRAFRLPACAWWPENGPEHRRHRRTRWRANPSDNHSNGSRTSRS